MNEGDVNTIVLVKGNEKYVFIYDDEHRTDALRRLGRFAVDEDLSFTWYDAAIVSQRIRALTEEAPAEGRPSKGLRGKQSRGGGGTGAAWV